MKKDLLYLYIQNHLSAYFIPPFIIAIFLWLKLFVYGYPEGYLNHIGAILVVISAIFYVRQRFAYKNILKKSDLSDLSLGKNLTHLIINKIGYIIPWLAVLFFPFQTDYIFDHLLGFVFVFLSIATAAALSPPALIIFILEISIQFLLACILLFINWNSIETPYILTGLVLFTGYACFIGYKLHVSAAELVNKNIELANIAAEAKQANMAKSDFLSMISHEIRTPMHGILSTIDYLKETKLNKDQISSLDVVTRCSKTLLDMLNDILDLSKIEAKKIKIENIDFNLNGLAKDALNIVRYSAEEKGLDLKYDISDDTPEYIHTDPVRLQQIINNLLSNAIKFTEYGSVTLLISSKKTIDDSQIIRVEVKDTGIGIDTKNQAKLFSKFEQADRSTTRQYGGTGLGLSIVKELTELMEGTYGLQSKKGEGSTFWVELPYQPSTSYHINSVHDNSTSAPSLPEGLQILIAEDNSINQKSIERILEKYKCKTEIVNNGEEAIIKAKDNFYDLILMDMNMPVMNGIESTKKIKSICDIPIVGLTATTEEKMIEHFYEAGIKDHITKPFSKADLLKGIKKNIQIISSKHKSNTDPSGIRGKLEEILDDFGEDFFFSFVEDSLDEIDRLNQILHNLFEEESFDAMHQFAHDICAVSGNIGMSLTYKAAKQAENNCLKSEHNKLQNQIESLNQAIDEDKKCVQDILKGLKNNILQ